jgi:dCMP deaminase
MMIDKWDKRYLEIAKQVSTWSKDPSTQVGAITVGQKGQILSTGFNGFPRGIDDSPERLNDRPTKYKYVVHAEKNVIYNACINTVSLDGSTLYVYGLPLCSECCKGIVQVGVRKVVMQYPSNVPNTWAESFDLTCAMLEEANITYGVYDERFERIL